jgi:hypothetical protein
LKLTIHPSIYPLAVGLLTFFCCGFLAVFVSFRAEWIPKEVAGLPTLVGEKTKLDLVEWMRNDENSRDLSIRSCEKS